MSVWGASQQGKFTPRDIAKSLDEYQVFSVRHLVSQRLQSSGPDISPVTPASGSSVSPWDSSRQSSCIWGKSKFDCSGLGKETGSHSFKDTALWIVKTIPFSFLNGLLVNNPAVRSNWKDEEMSRVPAKCEFHKPLVPISLIKHLETGAEESDTADARRKRI
ncbi:hypothetical protein CIHG_09230 [Coccidioides immitis H538.4]|uniref:Uncharacterized protein n=3 Tax=Coccidioides immitis TaxID=5501 RepID=A0A0J8R5D5_COCIT|nr:hypothetical protein CIRG_07765 [Coccidioides immitis RMSCC 2394]KMU79630.1 hypothetical protein CISG_02048 [Coccidioides immitis RMSCC 3703]KMU91477.1 hypothetical protein CIHG_09230 [Coccidioides immitis H538.4]